jgi:hypothetical protein
MTYQWNPTMKLFLMIIMLIFSSISLSYSEENKTEVVEISLSEMHDSVKMEIYQLDLKINKLNFEVPMTGYLISGKKSSGKGFRSTETAYLYFITEDKYELQATKYTHDSGIWFNRDFLYTLPNGSLEDLTLCFNDRIVWIMK